MTSAEIALHPEEMPGDDDHNTSSDLKSGSSSFHGYGHTRGYADAYPRYDQRGWPNSLKLPSAKKWPPPSGFTGKDGATPSAEDKAHWALDEPYGNTAQRLPESYIGIGRRPLRRQARWDTLAEAENRWGALPPTYVSTSRPDGVSGIRIYRKPEGVKLNGNIAFRELGLGDIEIIQYHHRYLVCWPSSHPDTGNTYLWYEPGYSPEHIIEADGPPFLSTAAELPEAWVEGLREKAKSKTTARITEETALVECPYIIEQCLTEGGMSPDVAKRLGEATGHCYSGTRHDQILKDSLALLRYGKQGEPGVFKAMSALGMTFVNAVTADGSRTEGEARAEFMRMLSTETAARLLSEPNDGVSRQGLEKCDNPKRWSALELEPAEQPRWLADSRLPRASVSLLLGDEGIGKSLLWVLLVAHITTGASFPGFGIPSRDPGRAVLVLTEDDWSTVVRPRLEIAGADLNRIEVICTRRTAADPRSSPGISSCSTPSLSPTSWWWIAGWIRFPRRCGSVTCQRARRCTRGKRLPPAPTPACCCWATPTGSSRPTPGIVMGPPTHFVKKLA